VLELESLFDHLYIEMILGGTRQQQVPRQSQTGGRVRWALTKLNEEALEGALLVAAWAGGAEESGRDLQEETE